MKKYIILILSTFLIGVYAHANCSKLSKAGDLRYGTRFEGRDYDVTVIVQLSNGTRCRPIGYHPFKKKSIWIPFTPSFETLSVANLKTLQTEAKLCALFAKEEKSWIRKIYANIDKALPHEGVYAGHHIGFTIKNSNRGGKLKRKIICKPDLFGFHPWRDEPFDDESK